MNEEHSFLTQNQIAQELDQDKSILKFILNRFSDRLPAEIHENRKVYDRKLLPIFIFINEQLNNGMTPTEIDSAIDGRFSANNSSAAQPTGPVPDSSHMEELFKQFHEDREKLAQAQEKRTEVEERKAAAMEKRADAEKQKAEAMNHIATALQNMQNQARGSGNPAEIAEKTAAAVTSFEEAHEPDDLMSLIDEIPDEQEPEREPSVEKPETDDLSALISDIETEQSSDSVLDEEEIDDLADLLDDEQPEAETPEKTGLDDLSMLIDQTDDITDDASARTDDLSLLIEEETSKNPDMALDDLSVLIQNEAEKEDSSGRSSARAETDDLSLLIEDEAPGSLQPDISPDEDFEAYKQAIINIIIELKQQGLTPEEACERLNNEGVRTLSGKPGWSVKTVSRIYKFIDSAA